MHWFIWSIIPSVAEAKFIGDVELPFELDLLVAGCEVLSDLPDVGQGQQLPFSAQNISDEWVADGLLLEEAASELLEVGSPVREEGEK